MVETAQFIEIVDWDEHYENNRTRELKKMAWVPMPNKQDGDGYTELLNHPNGAAHLGAWCALVEVASRCSNPVTIPQGGAGGCQRHPFGRGILMRSIGEPHDITSLSRITRIPESIWNEVLPRLVNIGWIRYCKISAVSRTQVRKSADANGSKPQEGAVECPMNGKERKGRERNRRTQVSAPETSVSGEGEDDDPFDEKEALEAAAPAVPPVPVPSDAEALKARIAEGEKSGDVAAVLMAGLELMAGHPFASYPKEWKAAHQVEEKIRRVGKGEHPLGFLRGLLQAFLAKRKSSKQEYWREAPLSPSAINVRFEQILGSVQRLASDAQGAQIVSDFLKERQAK